LECEEKKNHEALEPPKKREVVKEHGLAWWVWDDESDA